MSHWYSDSFWHLFQSIVSLFNYYSGPMTRKLSKVASDRKNLYSSLFYYGTTNYSWTPKTLSISWIKQFFGRSTRLFQLEQNTYTLFTAKSSSLSYFAELAKASSFYHPDLILLWQKLLDLSSVRELTAFT